MRKTVDHFTEGIFPKCFVCSQLKNKMGSRPHFCTSEDVPDKIYADPGSSFDGEGSYEEIMRNIMANNHFLSHLRAKN